LEQVIAKTAPVDYREPKQFFARTCFTRALREHAGMVLRRLSGETVKTRLTVGHGGYGTGYYVTYIQFLKGCYYFL